MEDFEWVIEDAAEAPWIIFGYDEEFDGDGA